MNRLSLFHHLKSIDFQNPCIEMQKLLLGILLTTSVIAQSQTESLLDVTPPSPTAYELGKFGSDKPNLYTGTASVSIPLYTIDFDGWKLPLSLSYDASGITANQDATEMGLGWALNATAVVTRTVKTNNDINDAGGTGEFLGYVYESDTPENFFNNVESYNAEGTFADFLDQKGFDGEPDDFNYNFFGYAGGFVFGKENNGTIPIVQKQLNGVQITFDQANSSFEIVTPNGFKGIFSIKERSTNFSAVSASGSGPYDDALVDLLAIQNRGNFRVISAWYLKKIVSPTGKEINFSYNVDDATNPNSQYVSLSQPVIGERIDCGAIPGNPKSFSRSAHEHVYLSSIVIPNELDISFSMEVRYDLNRNFMFETEYPVNILYPKRYTGMQITGLQTGSTFSRNITFKQSYFNLKYLHDHSAPDYNGESTQYQMLRGRLDHVIIDDQDYTFEYYSGLNGLPAKSTLGIDHFGYYNGKDLNIFVAPPLILSGPTAVSSNGGSLDNYFSDTKFQVYSQAETRRADINYGIAGALSKVVYPTGGSTTFFYEPHEYYATGLTNPTNPPTFNGFPYNNHLEAEVMTLSYGYPNYNQAGDVTAGGLRIATIETRDKDNILTSKTSYTYDLTNGNSSGELLSPLLYAQGSTGYLNGTPIYTIWFRTPSSFSANITAQGKRIGYSSVEEKVEDASGNGYKTLYEFHNEGVDTDAILNTKQYINDSSKNGRLDISTDYNSSNIPVRTNELLETESQPYTIYAVTYGPKCGNNGLGYAHQLLSATPVLQPINKQTTTTTYTNLTTNPPSGALVTSNTETYNDDAQVISSEMDNSDGSQYETVVKHLLDYGSTTCVTAAEGGLCLQDVFLEKNMKDNVLEKITYKDNEVVAAKGYRYDLEHGNLVLKEVFVYNPSLGPFTPSSNGLQFTGSYESRVTFDDYDVEGNLLQQTLKDGVPSSYIWGYNNNYPIVKGENITRANLLTAYSASQGSNYEADIRAHTLTTNALITTLDFDPLVGVSKITDPKGMPTNYNYNALNRLESITDSYQKIMQGYDYNYGDITKTGGLDMPSGLPFGTVAPNVPVTDVIPITNTGNYDVTVWSVTLPSYFSSPWYYHSFVVRPNETFNYPVIFDPPNYTININSNATINSNQISGDSSINITAEVVENGEPNLVLPQECFLFTYEFQTIYVTIQNTGTAPLYIYNITSDDACVGSSWEQSLKKWVTYAGGQTEQVYDPDASIIAAGSSRSFSVQLQCHIDSVWDTVSDLHINTYDPQTGSTGNGGYIYFRRYQSQCPAPPPPSGPTFVLSGDAIADCSSGMSGTLTINEGSVQVVNQSHVVSGPNFVGATITISGVATLSPGQSTIITPSTYPKTYSFSSTSCNCSNGYGTTELSVSEF